MVCTLRERVEVPRLARAWRAVADRHQALRAEFHWRGLDRPAQVFLDSVPVVIDESDWRGLGGQAQDERLSGYLAEDRARGFDLARPPLFRLACFRMEAERYEFVWSLPHIIADGRSMRMVLEEVFDAYESPGHLGEPPAYSGFLEWLRRREDSSAEAYWREALGGFAGPTRLAVDRAADREPAGPVSGPPRYWRRVFRLPESTTVALRALARRYDVTANTILQGA
jgi:NRPS condensation-like uncharacterized protein